MTQLLPVEPARREIKYVADETLAWHIGGWLKTHHAGFVTPYPARWVNNIYFDNPEYAAYAQNLAGISSRGKLRYRWYGEQWPIAAGQMEVKMRRSGLGRKLIQPIEDAPPAAGTWRDIIGHFRSHLAAGLQPWLSSFPIPVLINRYQRHYWATRDGHVRVTIDTGQAVFDQRYRQSPAVDRPANLPRTTVFEVKYLAEHSHMVRDVIASLPVSLSRHSKYAVGMDAIRSF